MKELSDDIWNMEVCCLVLELLPSELRFIRVLIFHSTCITDLILSNLSNSSLVHVMYSAGLEKLKAVMYGAE